MFSVLLKINLGVVLMVIANLFAQTLPGQDINWLTEWKSAIVMLGDIGRNRKGQQAFIVIGTGFLVYNYSKPHEPPFLVTARHIFQPNFGAYLKSIRVRLPSKTPKLLTEDFGYELKLIDEKGTPLWKGHPAHSSDNPVDVAAIRLDLYVSEDIKATCIPYSYFMNTYSLYESDAIMCLGYPGNVSYLNEIYLTQPVLKSGIISWISSSQRINPMCLLIDIPTFGGNSGSPVFLAPTVQRLIHPDTIGNIIQPICIGLVSRFVPEINLSYDENGMILLQVGQNSGLTEVVPTEMIIETLKLLGNP